MTLLERDQRNIERGKVEGLERGIELGKAEGIEQGIEQGKAEEKIAAARNLRLLGVSDEVIAKAMGLSEEVVRELLNS